MELSARYGARFGVAQPCNGRGTAIALALGGLACGGIDSESVGTVDQPLIGTGPCASLEQLDSACPADAAWRNHGRYVSCVAHYLNRRLAAGDIDADTKGVLQAMAAQSDVGKVPGAPGPLFMDAMSDEDANGRADVCEPDQAPPQVVPGLPVLTAEGPTPGSTVTRP
jgi:hypothetical protein